LIARDRLSFGLMTDERIMVKTVSKSKTTRAAKAAKPAARAAKSVKPAKAAKKPARAAAKPVRAVKKPAKATKPTKVAKKPAKAVKPPKATKKPAKAAKPTKPVTTKPVTKKAKSVTKTPAKSIKPAVKSAKPVKAAAKPAKPAPKPATAAAKPAPAPVKAAAKPEKPAKAKPAKLPFAAGDYVVYPTHGVGQVSDVVTEEIAGFKLRLFVINFAAEKMTLRVPIDKADESGLRKISSRDKMQTAIGTLRGKARAKRTMWSRRAQEYEAKINSGDPVSIAEVVRDLHRGPDQPDQSYSERQMYEAALNRLAHEMALVEKIEPDAATERLETLLLKAA